MSDQLDNLIDFIMDDQSPVKPDEERYVAAFDAAIASAVRKSRGKNVTAYDEVCWECGQVLDYIENWHLVKCSTQTHSKAK